MELHLKTTIQSTTTFRDLRRLVGLETPIPPLQMLPGPKSFKNLPNDHRQNKFVILLAISAHQPRRINPQQVYPTNRHLTRNPMQFEIASSASAAKLSSCPTIVVTAFDYLVRFLLVSSTLFLSCISFYSAITACICRNPSLCSNTNGSGIPIAFVLHLIIERIHIGACF